MVQLLLAAKCNFLKEGERREQSLFSRVYPKLRLHFMVRPRNHEQRRKRSIGEEQGSRSKKVETCSERVEKERFIKLLSYNSIYYQKGNFRLIYNTTLSIFFFLSPRKKRIQKFCKMSMTKFMLFPEKWPVRLILFIDQEERLGRGEWRGNL